MDQPRSSSSVDPGAASFWVDYDRGVAIHEALAERLGGAPEPPAYVVDLPDGSGKIPVATALARGRLDPTPSVAVRP